MDAGGPDFSRFLIRIVAPSRTAQELSGCQPGGLFWTSRNVYSFRSVSMLSRVNEARSLSGGSDVVDRLRDAYSRRLHRFARVLSACRSAELPAASSDEWDV